jgi:hypothetical protein
MDCRTISKVLGRLRMVCPVQKCVSEMSLHFQLELNALVFLCPHRQKSKELSSAEQGGCLEINFSRTYIDINFIPIVWCGKLTPEVFFQAIWIHPVLARALGQSRGFTGCSLLGSHQRTKADRNRQSCSTFYTYFC